ncbi:MAG: heparinase II/III family protein [Marinicaulis sp.]|nr:heparinase II/III family protein [Marinicaulis sp.]
MSVNSQSKTVSSARSARGLVKRVQQAWNESIFYEAQLKGPAPDRLLYSPDDPYSVDKSFAASLIRGEILLADERSDNSEDLASVWADIAETSHLFNYMQSFEWLRHLSAAGTNGGNAAKILTKSWLENFDRPSARAWEPYLVSERLIHLCAHYDVVHDSKDALWRSRVFSSMARQTRHLAKTAHRANSDFDRLCAALGLSIAGYCLPGCDVSAQSGMEMLRRELRLQIRADGGHFSRNPSRQLKTAVRLKQLLAVIEHRNIALPAYLHNTVMRVCAMAKFFRCGDGRLAVFNGGYEDDSGALIGLNNNGVNKEYEPLEFARHTGYHRLTSGRSVVFIDTCANVGPRSFDSAGSFQFTSGRSRIFVNCGNGSHQASEWGSALCDAAAHSKVSFDVDRRKALVFRKVNHWRSDDVNGQLVEFHGSSEDSDPSKISFERQIYLSSGGGDLRGNDTLCCDCDTDALAAAWRFHIHPSVRVSLSRDQRSAILLLKNGEGWRFKSNAKQLEIEKSVYCGEGANPIATEQIVIRASDAKGSPSEKLNVKWALQLQS